MNRRRIAHHREEVKIYRNHYKRSFNLIRFFKSILGVLIFGSTTVAHSYAPIQKRKLK
jgi:hypothetical protein